jgi:hypothetical protein
LLALAAGTLLLLTYQWHHERWLVVLGTVAAAACLTIAIDRRSLLWDGICILGLSLAMFRCWNEPVWTVVYAAVGAFGLVQIFRKTRFRNQFRDAKHWPLTKGGFSGNYEDGGDRVIYYGYKVGDSHYSGFVVAGSTLIRGLKSRLDDLKGRPAFIRYKPDQPQISTLFKSDQLESTL